MSLLHGPRRISLAPNNLPGLTCWLRDAYTDAGGGAVSQWTDKSGNGNHATQGTGANRPIASTDGAIGGHEKFTFDGSNDQLDVALKSALITSTAFTIYGLLNVNAATRNDTFLTSTNGILQDSGSSAESPDFMLTHRPGVSRVAYFNASPAQVNSNNATLADTTWTKVCWSYDGSKVYARRAGDSDAGATASANVTTMSRTFRLMGSAYNSPYIYVSGSLAEMIFYNQYHSVAVQDALFAYQSRYFGI